MQFSFTLGALVLLSFANAVPAVNTIYSTAFTTVTVNGAGETITPTPEPEPTTTYTVRTTITIISDTTIGVVPTETTPPVEQGNLLYGDGTYFYPGMGACGFVSHESEYIVAVSQAVWDPQMVDANPNNNPICGKKIRAYYDGKSVEATIVDKCMGCAPNDLDFAPVAFTQLAHQDLGRIKIAWEWI